MDKTETLELPFPTSLRYDITLPLCDGRVAIDGVTLRPSPKITSMVTKDVPELREGRFGLLDLNVGFWLAAVDAGWELTALPVFSKRKPAYQFIFVHADAGISSPADLAGKTVGTRQYRTALSIWARGLLAERHGVDIRAVRWVAQVPEAFPNHDKVTRIDYVPDSPSIVDRFLAGEVDALCTDISDAKTLAQLEADPRVRRLFVDYRAEDEALLRATGIYTPVHVIVMSRPLARQHPELARKLYDGFVKAKQIAYDDALSDKAGFSVAWQREILKDQLERYGDLWAYGVAANRGTIDAFVRYNADQGVTRTRLPDGAIFAPGTLDT
ncbi:MAG TPA: PhnD/SsuA/transferrin family substrate-binding protein [Alphaproteobacteria bacterium]|jgi:4,5-dihydroxyphthalate decarboxylase